MCTIWITRSIDFYTKHLVTLNIALGCVSKRNFSYVTSESIMS